MFTGEEKNTHKNLNEFLNKVFDEVKTRNYGTLELKTKTGRPDVTTYYEIQFIYKPSNYDSDNIQHTELRQINHDDNYTIEDIVKGRIYDVERKAKENFNKIQIEKSKNCIYLHVGNF